VSSSIRYRSYVCTAEKTQVKHIPFKNDLFVVIKAFFKRNEPGNWHTFLFGKEDKIM